MKKQENNKKCKSGTYNKFNVINEFSNKSNEETKIEVNNIIKKLCINELEIIYNSDFNDAQFFERSIKD